MEGTVFSVRTTEPSLLDSMARYLGERLPPERDSEAVYTYLADCREDRVLTGGKLARGVHSLYLQHMLVYRGREREEMAARAIASMRDLAAIVVNDFVRVRAGAIAFEEGALLMPSPPEPHLPALTGLFVREGGGYLGDEMVKVDPILRNVHGVRLPLLIDVSDSELFPELGPPVKRRRQARGREAITPRLPVTPEELGGMWARPTPPRWIVFPSFEPGEETRLEPIGPSEALIRFTSAILNMHVWRDRALLLMQELLEQATVWRLIVGRLPEAPRVVMDAIAGEEVRR